MVDPSSQMDQWKTVFIYKMTLNYHKLIPQIEICDPKLIPEILCGRQQFHLVCPSGLSRLDSV